MADSPDRNLSLIIAYNFFAYMGRSIWGETVLSAYVYIIMGSYSTVGYITGIRGIAQIAFAPIFGWLADKGRRDTMLYIAAFVGYSGAAVSIVATYYEHYWGLCVAMFLWGAYWGVSSPAIDALFADCIPDGMPCFVLNPRRLMANTSGPLVSIALFWWLGNHWDAGTCKLVMYVGLVLTVFPNTILFWLRDRKNHSPALDGEAEDALREPLLEDEEEASNATDTAAKSAKDAK
eukprot:gene24390-29645_t